MGNRMNGDRRNIEKPKEMLFIEKMKD